MQGVGSHRRADSFVANETDPPVRIYLGSVWLAHVV
jgi:hypothetical protein